MWQAKAGVLRQRCFSDGPGMRALIADTWQRKPNQMPLASVGGRGLAHFRNKTLAHVLFKHICTFAAVRGVLGVWLQGDWLARVVVPKPLSRINLS